MSSVIRRFTHSPIHAFTHFFVAVLLFAGALSVKAHDPITTKVTWSREVVRIVNTRCANCHNKESVGPMPLTTYEEVRPWAKAIKDEVVSRRMPPWPAARGFGHFTNDPTLSPFEIELIAAWVDGGAPKGEDRDLPARESYQEPPAPTFVLRLPQRTSAPAGEKRTVILPTTFNRDQWITGWRFVPNDPAIVQVELEFDKADAVLGTLVPPWNQVVHPGHAGRLLPRYQSLRVTVTYRSGRIQEDFPVGLPAKSPAIGLILVDRKPEHQIRQEVLGCNSRAGGVTTLRDYPSTDLTRQRAAAPPAVLRPEPYEPPAPLREYFGVRVSGVADGGSVGVELAGAPVLWIRRFDASYQPTYRFQVVTSSESDIRTYGVDGSPQCRVVVDYLTPPR